VDLLLILIELHILARYTGNYGKTCTMNDDTFYSLSAMQVDTVCVFGQYQVERKISRRGNNVFHVLRDWKTVMTTYSLQTAAKYVDARIVKLEPLKPTVGKPYKTRIQVQIESMQFGDTVNFREYSINRAVSKRNLPIFHIYKDGEHIWSVRTVARAVKYADDMGDYKPIRQRKYTYD